MPRVKVEKPKFTVIRDTREKDGQGWSFSASTTCSGTKSGALKTGDYSIEGLESVVCVERKGCISEFARNLTEARFERELARMASFSVAVVILEFDYEELIRWPDSADLPKFAKARIRINGHGLQAKLFALISKYPNINFIFAGSYGKDAARAILKRAWFDHGPARKTG